MSDVVIGSDLMMRNSDLAVSVSGDLSIVNDNDNLVQTAVNNMRTIYGELETDPTRGNMIFTKRVKTTASGMELVKDDCRRAILQDTRVKDVPFIDVRNLGNFRCIISFTIKRYDDVVVDGTTTITLRE